MAAVFILAMCAAGFAGGVLAYLALDLSLIAALAIWGASGPFALLLVALTLALKSAPAPVPSAKVA